MNYSAQRLAVVALAVLAACKPMVDTRGHTTDPEDFKQIVTGQSRSEDVAAVLGYPTTRSNFGRETWYYITERKETLGLYAPEVADQTVTAVHFDDNQLVESIETYGKDDAKNIEVVKKTTRTEGHEMTMIEQLLGNLGRFGTPGRQVDPRGFGR
jgi:outer membrane protein assembly factor BamE (lipoprotein component of BamABCDE complex)